MKRMPRIPLVSLVIAFYGLQVAAADELTQMVEDSLSQLATTPVWLTARLM